MEPRSDTQSPVPGPTDRELVVTMRTPGSGAFEILFRRYADAVHSLIITRITNSALVDDVHQETFVLAWQKLDARKMVGDSILPWLVSTAQYLVANANRATASTARSIAPLDEVDLDDEDSTFEAVAKNAQSAALDDALARLRDRDRRIVALCLEHDMQYKEAARATRTSTSGVRNTLFRARRALQRDLASVREDGNV